VRSQLHEINYLQCKIISSSSSLLAPQTCVSPGLLHGFVRVDVRVSGMELLVPCQSTNLEDQRLRFLWSLPLTRVGRVALSGAYDPASIALRITGARAAPVDDKMIILENVYNTLLMFIEFWLQVNVVLLRYAFRIHCYILFLS
jgi:hypothetical protein